MQKVGLAYKMLDNKPHFTKVNVLIKSGNNIRFAELLRTDRAKRRIKSKAHTIRT